MSIHESPNGAIPQLTVGWRIQMALDHAGITTADIAERLDVTRSTISRWSNDHGAPPKRLYLDAIAHHTEVSAEWLKTGAEPTNAPDPDGASGDVTSEDRFLNAKRNVQVVTPIWKDDRAA